MVVIVVVIVVLVSLYPLSLACHLFQRRTFIYYCTSIRLCIGGQAALASVGIKIQNKATQNVSAILLVRVMWEFRSVSVTI